MNVNIQIPSFKLLVQSTHEFDFPERRTKWKRKSAHFQRIFKLLSFKSNSSLPETNLDIKTDFDAVGNDVYSGILSLLWSMYPWISPHVGCDDTALMVYWIIVGMGVRCGKPCHCWNVTRWHQDVCLSYVSEQCWCQNCTTSSFSSKKIYRSCKET